VFSDFKKKVVDELISFGTHTVKALRKDSLHRGDVDWMRIRVMKQQIHELQEQNADLDFRNSVMRGLLVQKEEETITIHQKIQSGLEAIKSRMAMFHTSRDDDSFRRISGKEETIDELEQRGKGRTNVEEKGTCGADGSDGSDGSSDRFGWNDLADSVAHLEDLNQSIAEMLEKKETHSSQEMMEHAFHKRYAHLLHRKENECLRLVQELEQRLSSDNPIESREKSIEEEEEEKTTLASTELHKEVWKYFSNSNVSYLTMRVGLLIDVSFSQKREERIPREVDRLIDDDDDDDDDVKDRVDEMKSLSSNPRSSAKEFTDVAEPVVERREKKVDQDDKDEANVDASRRDSFGEIQQIDRKRPKKKKERPDEQFDEILRNLEMRLEASKESQSNPMTRKIVPHVSRPKTSESAKHSDPRASFATFVGMKIHFKLHK
jgi:hypothetical protein